jgi:DNA-binding GntR family transcriptional regulator
VTKNVLNIESIKGEDFSLKHRIYKLLKEAILSTNIYDDDVDLKLDERTISEQFGISRTPLREAMARLEHEGLVRVIARRGVYIVRKSKDEILDMILAWAALESMAARMATEVATAVEFKDLRGIVDEFDSNHLADHADEYSESNIRFHQTIIKLGKSDQIIRMADEILMHVRAIRARTITDANRIDRSLNDHLEIVAALESRDADLAASLVREHSLNLRKHVALNLHI